MGLIDTIRDFALTRSWYKTRGEEDVYVEDEIDDTEGRDEEPDETSLEKAALLGSGGRRRYSAGPSKIYSFPSTEKQVTVYKFYPGSIDEAEDIKDYIKDGEIVIVHLESVQREVAQRIVDFLSGVVHALDGEIGYITNKVFLLTPKDVGYVGALKEELREGGILASLKASFR